MREEDFFSNIATRLGRSTPLTTPPIRDVIGAPDFWREYSLSTLEKMATYQAELEKLGGHAEIFKNHDELREGLVSLLQELSPTRIGTWGGDTLDEFDLGDVLQPYEIHRWEALHGDDPAPADQGSARHDLISTFAKMDVGITGVDFAIANTGSIVVLCDPMKGRSVSLLPTVHIAIIRASQIRTRMGEVLEVIANRKGDPQKMSSSINFISGPSRSSDIENDLSIGVHGPVAFYALILED